MMTTDSIAARLAKSPSRAEILELQAACGARQAAIRARIQEIAPQPGSEPPARTAAARKGLEALRDLDREIETLHAEHAFIDRLGLELLNEDDVARAREAEEKIPGAKRKLPAAVKRARAAFAELAAAISAAEAIVATLMEYPHTRDKRVPLTDAEIAELLEVRAEIWALADFPTLGFPDDRDAYPKSWPLAYVERGGPLARKYAVRRRPGIPAFAEDYPVYS